MSEKVSDPCFYPLGIGGVRACHDAQFSMEVSDLLCREHHYIWDYPLLL
jgi:hypothetical protein